MYVLPCIAPSNTHSPLRASKAIWNPIISFTPSSLGYCQQTLSIHVFMYNPHHLYHFPQPKLQQKWKTNKQMGKKANLLCSESGITCIYLRIQACFCLTMQYGHTAMCVALKNKQTKEINHHNDPALKNTWESRFCRMFHASFGNSSRWF